MTVILQTAVAILPVFLFLGILTLLDTYKLIKFRTILIIIASGCAAAILAWLLNLFFLKNTRLEPIIYASYAAPFVEELLKAIYPIFLLKKKRIGFMVDAAITGFAVGAGFAFIENLYYLKFSPDANLFLWIIRGFGTAVMHGGTTSVFCIVSKYLTESRKHEGIHLFLPGWFAAVAMHALFNRFFLPPLAMTLGQLVFFPTLIVLIFDQSEKKLRGWLDVGMDSDINLLEYIKSGTIKKTNIGIYLQTIREKFPQEVVFDMLCYIRIHIELALRAKGILIARESGLEIVINQETRDKVTELKFLEKSIGKTGQLAIAPMLRTSTQDLWQLFLIEKR